jgi:speckle-type POZ protein
LPAEVYYAFDLVNHRDETMNRVYKFCKLSNEWTKNISWGFGNMISHADLFKDESDWFPDGKLRFVAKIIAKTRTHSTISAPTECWKLLYETMKHSNLIIRTSDKKELKAHKSVLCVRSDVFDRMFSHDTKESRTGIIEIKDFHSDVVSEMLRFLYCEVYFNDVKELESQQTLQLYCAADKYQINELKTFCLNSIYNQLNASNVLEVAVFADLFDLKHLFSCCIFIIIA